MISFWYGDTLLKGNFKNTKLIKICGGNRWSDRSFFTKKNLTKLTVNNLPRKRYDQLLVWYYLTKNSKHKILLKHLKATDGRPFLFLLEKINQIDN